MACRVGDMSATCLWSCRRLGDIACRLECLNDTTFDDMSPTLCTTEVHDCFVRGDFDRETMASSPPVHIMGYGGRTPSTQYISVILTSRATRRCTGSEASVHHSLRNFTIFGVTFCMHNITRKSIIN